MARKTVDRDVIVATANSMIAHLAAIGTKDAADKRSAIIAATSDILIKGGAYRGFQYLNTNPPVDPQSGFKLWDETRIRFN